MTSPPTSPQRLWSGSTPHSHPHFHPPSFLKAHNAFACFLPQPFCLKESHISLPRLPPLLDTRYSPTPPLLLRKIVPSVIFSHSFSVVDIQGSLALSQIITKFLAYPPQARFLPASFLSINSPSNPLQPSFYPPVYWSYNHDSLQWCWNEQIHWLCLRIHLCWPHYIYIALPTMDHFVS